MPTSQNTTPNSYLSCGRKTRARFLSGGITPVVKLRDVRCLDLTTGRTTWVSGTPRVVQRDVLTINKFRKDLPKKVTIAAGTEVVDTTTGETVTIKRTTTVTVADTKNIQIFTIGMVGPDGVPHLLNYPRISEDSEIVLIRNSTGGNFAICVVPKGKPLTTTIVYRSHRGTREVSLDQVSLAS